MARYTSVSPSSSFSAREGQRGVRPPRGATRDLETDRDVTFLERERFSGARHPRVAQDHAPQSDVVFRIDLDWVLTGRVGHDQILARLRDPHEGASIRVDTNLQQATAGRGVLRANEQDARVARDERMPPLARPSFEGERRSTRLDHVHGPRRPGRRQHNARTFEHRDVGWIDEGFGSTGPRSPAVRGHAEIARRERCARGRLRREVAEPRSAGSNPGLSRSTTPSR